MTDGFDPQSRYGRKHAAKLQRAAAESRSTDDARSGPSARDPHEPFVGWRFVRSRRWLGYFAIAVASRSSSRWSTSSCMPVTRTGNERDRR